VCWVAPGCSRAPAADGLGDLLLPAAQEHTRARVLRCVCATQDAEAAAELQRALAEKAAAELHRAEAEEQAAAQQREFDAAQALLQQQVQRPATNRQQAAQPCLSVLPIGLLSWQSWPAPLRRQPRRKQLQLWALIASGLLLTSAAGGPPPGTSAAGAPAGRAHCSKGGAGAAAAAQRARGARAGRQVQGGQPRRRWGWCRQRWWRLPILSAGSHGSSVAATTPPSQGAVLVIQHLCSAQPLITMHTPYTTSAGAAFPALFTKLEARASPAAPWPGA
jgi:hypothetical protein